MTRTSFFKEFEHDRMVPLELYNTIGGIENNTSFDEGQVLPDWRPKGSGNIFLLERIFPHRKTSFFYSGFFGFFYNMFVSNVKEEKNEKESI